MIDTHTIDVTTTSDKEKMLQITLAYANAPVVIDKNGKDSNLTQHMLVMNIVQGTTIYQALQLSGWLDTFVELKLWSDEVLAMVDSISTAPIAKNWRVGIYSTKQPLDYILRDKDRIEIYRSLTADPMKRRRNKAK